MKNNRKFKMNFNPFILNNRCSEMIDKCSLDYLKEIAKTKRLVGKGNEINVHLQERNKSPALESSINKSEYIDKIAQKALKCKQVNFTDNPIEFNEGKIRKTNKKLKNFL